MGEAFDRICTAFQQSGLTVVHRGDGQASAQAPGHSPADRSVSIKSVEGMALMSCHAGEQTEDVLAQVGLAMRDLFNNGREARHEYPDGRVVLRSYTTTGKKSFTQRGNTEGNALYHADQIGDAEVVYYCEGEKDVLAIESVGGTAVCNAMGAGKSHLADLTPLYGKTVIIVAHKDDAGRKHANAVATTLEGKAEVRIGRGRGRQRRRRPHRRRQVTRRAGRRRNRPTATPSTHHLGLRDRPRARRLGLAGA